MGMQVQPIGIVGAVRTAALQAVQDVAAKGHMEGQGQTLRTSGAAACAHSRLPLGSTQLSPLTLNCAAGLNHAHKVTGSLHTNIYLRPHLGASRPDELNESLLP